MMRKTTLSLIAFAALACVALTQQVHAGPRLDKIMDSKVIRVGTPGDYRPFAIKTSAGYSGHDIDVIEHMAKELGVKVEYVPTTWPNLMKDIQADKFDVAVGGITRNVMRIRQIEMLPGYAPFGKVALVRAADKAKYKALAFVLENLKATQIGTHEKNAEIPALIADGKGDVMITETYEALHYSKADPRLYAAFIDAPLTPTNTLGFMLPKDDADYSRVMEFVWGLMDNRGTLKQASQDWLK